MADIFAQALEVWEKCGRNQCKAAKELGIPRATLQGRLRSAKLGLKCDKDVPVVIKAEADETLQKRVGDLEAALEVARRPRAKFGDGKAPKRQKGDFKRVAIPDTHGQHVDQQALKATLADIKELKPSEIVLLGDHIDCGGFLAQHHVMGYVAETRTSFEEDVAATNAFLDAVQNAAPQATIHYIEGNHERRIERWIVTQTLRHPADSAMFKRWFGVEACLSLKKRGIQHYEQGQAYCDLRVPCTIKLGKCYFTHGHRTGRHPAAQMLKDFGANVVFGHCHRRDTDNQPSVEAGDIGAWSPGCLSQKQPLWMHSAPTTWAHGYHLQLCRGNGDFLPVNVPVIDGKSFLVPLLR